MRTRDEDFDEGLATRTRDEDSRRGLATRIGDVGIDKQHS